MTVEVPCKKIVTVNNDGTRNPEAVRELYTYQTDSSWKLLGSVDVTDETGEKTAVKHLYAYAGAQGTCTVVKPQETTKNLFREVTFVNAKVRDSKTACIRSKSKHLVSRQQI